MRLCNNCVCTETVCVHAVEGHALCHKVCTRQLICLSARSTAFSKNHSSIADTRVVECRLKIKLGGGSANGQASGQSSNGKGSKEGHDRWMAECADCGEEGDLLCCEVIGTISSSSSVCIHSII